MGWDNYIVVSKLKLLIKISRHTELDDFQSMVLDRLFDGSIEELDLTKLRPDDMTVKDIAILADAHRKLEDIYTIDSADSLFMYWLKSKGIEYEILHEDNIHEYYGKGYTIL